MKNRLILFLGVFISLNYFAQQDEQSSLYMFNSLQFNPAYAGSRGALNASLIHRSQWVGLEGAPTTQFLSLHTPFARNSMGAGMHVSHDTRGATSRTSAFGDLSYSIPFGPRRKHRINIGLSGGIDAMNVSFKKLVGDEADPFKVDASQINFNAGAGVYYYSKNAYVGLSMPRMLNTDWTMGTTASLVKRHFFLAAGWVKPLNSVTDLKLSTLIKIVQNAPITVDLNANVFFYKSFWIGGMYRYNESAGVNIAYQFQEKWMFGYAYDFVFNGLRNTGLGGTHEIMLTYDMNGRRTVYASPRYF
jgi:type IX secretion system PorP/SprF family membrane protein